MHPDIEGTVTSHGYNLIGNSDGAGITAQTGDQIGTGLAPIDPLLGQLQDNGGPTKTRALLSGSPAIDRRNSSQSATTDQRGFARPVDDPTRGNATNGDGSDIGAFEMQAGDLSGCEAITFNATAGELYRLERKAALTDAQWESITDLDATSSGTMQLTDTNAAISPQAIYRVRVVR
jgi:hypothetical protein